MMNLRKAHARVVKLAPSDPDTAVAIARQIPDGGLKCLALAYVARYAKEAYVEKLAFEALAAGRGLADPFGLTCVPAWPIRALIERRHTTPVEEMVGEALRASKTIEHPVSRLVALFSLWQAVFPFAGPVRDCVQAKFLTACRGANSWKAGDRLSQAALVLAREDPVGARALASHLRAGRLKRTTFRRIADGEFDEPQKFFFSRGPN